MPRPLRRLAAIVAVALLLAGCGGGGGGDDEEAVGSGDTTDATDAESDDGDEGGGSENPFGPASDEPPPADTNAGVEGELRLGGSRQAASTTVGPRGGTVGITSGPLSGLAIEVPEGAYTSNVPFEISLTEIRGATYGPLIDPITPLVTVEAQGYAADVLRIRVPVRVPEGHAVLGFYYDPDSGALEGMPIVEVAADHVTLATRHFSSWFVSAIEWATLPEDIGTGFRVGEDNWQFVNWGTYPEPDGICAGMSLTSMWYFLEQKDAQGQLWNRYDDDGRQDTPGFWQDDAHALRWATDVQTGIDWSSMFRKVSKRVAKAEFDRLQLDAFRYSMAVTGEPQYVAITSADGAGHAMVVYAASGRQLWVADPNYPRDLREIRYDFGKDEFEPFNSGANATAIASGDETSYIWFTYVAKTALVDWGWMGQGFQSMLAGRSGTGFPTWQIKVSTTMPDGSEFVERLTDGYLTSLPALKLGVEAPFAGLLKVYEGTADEPVLTVPAGVGTSWFTLPLGLGTNRFGFSMIGFPPEYVNDEYFVDFERVKLFREEVVTTTTTAPPPTTVAPPPASPPTTVDCSQFARGTIAWVECTLHTNEISER